MPCLPFSRSASQQLFSLGFRVGLQAFSHPENKIPFLELFYITVFSSVASLLSFQKAGCCRDGCDNNCRTSSRAVLSHQLTFKNHSFFRGGLLRKPDRVVAIFCLLVEHFPLSALQTFSRLGFRSKTRDLYFHASGSY